MNSLHACKALVEWANTNRSVTLSGKLLEAVTLAREAQEAPPQAHTPSAGAVQAAHKLNWHGIVEDESEATAANIIDRETGHASLVAALQAMHTVLTRVVERGHCAKFADATAGEMGNAITLLQTVSAALAKAKGQS